MSTKRDDENITAFTMRRVINAEIEVCAKIAEAKGKELGEPAIGHAIAQEIRKSIQS